MLLLAAVAIAASSQPGATSAPANAVVQARATVRIVSAVRLRWGEKQRNSDIPAPRTTVIQTVDGPEPAKLIEFE